MGTGKGGGAGGGDDIIIERRERERGQRRDAIHRVHIRDFPVRFGSFQYGYLSHSIICRRCEIRCIRWFFLLFLFLVGRIENDDIVAGRRRRIGRGCC